MRRSTTLALLLLAVAAGLVVNATIFAYRALQGTVNVVEPIGTSDQLASYGAACAGFYIAPNGLLYDGGAQALPPAGSNANSTFAAAGSSLGVTTVLSGVACSWSDTDPTTGATYGGTTYLTATVNVNVTAGTWYFMDILGFGYPAFSTPSPVYLYIKVEDPLATTNIVEAKLILYNATTTPATKVAEYDIMTLNAIYGPIELSSGTGLQIDLWLNAAGSATDSFKLGFYVAKSEPPR